MSRLLRNQDPADRGDGQFSPSRHRRMVSEDSGGGGPLVGIDEDIPRPHDAAEGLSLGGPPLQVGVGVMKPALTIDADASTSSSTVPVATSLSPRTTEAMMMGRWLAEPELGLWMIHNNGKGMPLDDLELQDLLAAPDLTPSYSLNAIQNLTAEKAACVIWAEMDTNFRNCLAHIREARQRFPTDTLFRQADLQVIAYLRENAPADITSLSCGTAKPKAQQQQSQKKGFFSKLFANKDEKKEKKKGKGKDGADSNNGGEDEVTGLGSDQLNQGFNNPDDNRDPSLDQPHPPANEELAPPAAEAIGAGAGGPVATEPPGGLGAAVTGEKEEKKKSWFSFGKRDSKDETLPKPPKEEKKDKKKEKRKGKDAKAGGLTTEPDDAEEDPE